MKLWMGRRRDPQGIMQETKYDDTDNKKNCQLNYFTDVGGLLLTVIVWRN